MRIGLIWWMMFNVNTRYIDMEKKLCSVMIFLCCPFFQTWLRLFFQIADVAFSFSTDYAAFLFSDHSRCGSLHDWLVSRYSAFIFQFTPVGKKTLVLFTLWASGPQPPTSPLPVCLLAATLWNVTSIRLFVCLFGFYGISTYVGYLMTNPFYTKTVLFQAIQFVISTQFKSQKSPISSNSV